MQDLVNATLPSYTVDDGQGFIAEDHKNVTNEEELTNVTLKADVDDDNATSFRNEKHDGIENEEVRRTFWLVTFLKPNFQVVTPLLN